MAQWRGNVVPVVDPIPVTQDVAKERVKFHFASAAIGTGAQRLQHCFTIALPYRGHDAAMLALIIATKRAHRSRDVPAVQQPLTLCKFSLPHPLESFIPIA